MIKIRRPHNSATSKEIPRLVAGVTAGTSALQFYRGQLKWLSEHGWEVTLICNPEEKATKAALREAVELHPIPMSRQISPISDARAFWSWLVFLNKYRPSAVSVGTPKAALLGIVSSAILRVPKRLYVVRGLRLEGSEGVQQAILWLMEFITMKLATDVFFVSRSLSDECRRRGLNTRNRHWLIGEGSSNGVDFQAIEKDIALADSSTIRDFNGISSSDFVIGFVGRITRDKGVDVIIQAASNPRLNEGIRFLLIGPIEDASLADKLARLGDRVIVLGERNPAWELFPAIDVLCLPTRREGFPNVVLEAAAAGIPTITTRATGAIDSVIEGKTGLLFDIDNLEELVGHLNTLQKDPKHAKQLGSAARDWVKMNFKPEIIWQGLNEILKGESSPKFAIRIH